MKAHLTAVAVAALSLLAPAGPALGQAGGKPLPPVARIRSEVNLFLELHNHLMFAARSAEDTLPEYRSQVQAYRDARELSKEPAVWRIVSDACVNGPDMAAIGRAADNLPAGLEGPDREAARKALGALASAWPRFEAHDLVERTRSLQHVWANVLRRRFSLGLEERLMTTLYEKMAFQPLDAPITVYPVINVAELGLWGKTAKGYYTVIPAGPRPGLLFIETLVHELTHVIDENQPRGSSTVLTRLRQKAAGADKETLDAFLHGLVSWNAGELIRRFGVPTHKPLVDMSPQDRSELEPFLPTYQGPWVAYLEGKISAEDAIEGMAASLRPASPAPKKTSD